MSKSILKNIFALVFLIFLINAVFAEQTTCIYFFYGNGCPHCGKVEPFIEELESKYSFLEVKKFEIYNDRENSILLNNYFIDFNVPVEQRGVPVVFIAEKYLASDGPILDNLENDIFENIGAVCLEIDANTFSSQSSSDKLSELSLLTIVGAAFVDSINPCAIAVLLILLGALMVSGDKKRALKAGIAFTVSIYIAYFLFGLGLFSALQISGLSFWFFKIIGVVAIIIGLANIKDYFWYGGGGFVMEVPRSWRPSLKKMLSGITSPFGAFLAGFVVCLFELPCTGGPYIVILGLLAERMTAISAIPLLALYNLVFVLPLVVITFAIYFGFASTENTNEWKEKNIRKLHLVAGIIMLILGIAITTGII